MKYGYARVSTSDQDLEIQKNALLSAGCEVVREEKVSGTSLKGRSELTTLLEFLRKGDELVVTRIDRLARSMRDLQNIVHDLTEKGDGSGDDTSASDGTVPEIMLEKQVFHIPDNVYTYKEAQSACKSLGARLATRQEVASAQAKGANWCNYGWSKDQMALYPTQKCTWDKLQQGPKKHRNDCGKPGVNGGYFENPYLKFGVNCYGYKPEPTLKEKEIVKLSTNPYLTQKEKELNDRVDYYKSQRYDTTILPFSKDRWSEV